MQRRSSDENSVCLSVCLSVKRVICDKTKESCYTTWDFRNHSAVFCVTHDSLRYINILTYLLTYLLTYMKDHLPSFVTRRMVGGATPSTCNFWSTGPRWSEIADFQPIFARSDSAVTPSEKKFN